MGNDVLTQAPVLGEIPDVQSLDPVLRREWAEARLQDIKRNGRSELDTVGKGLELVISVVRELEKGAWPRVVSEKGLRQQKKASPTTRLVSRETLEGGLGERSQL